MNTMNLSKKMVICKPQHNKQQCQRAYGMEIPRGGLEKAPIAHQNIRQAKIFCILLTCLLSSSMLVGLNSNNYFAFFVEGVMTSENFYMFLCSVRSKDPLLIIRFRQGQKERWKRKIKKLNDLGKNALSEMSCVVAPWEGFQKNGKN